MPSSVSLVERAVLAVLVVVGLPQFAQAAFIDLISQSYEIHERVVGCCPPFPDVNQISATPISRTDFGMFVDSMGVPGGYYMFTSTNGGITPLSAFVQAQSSSYDLSQAVIGVADARAAITFRPLVTNLVLQTQDPWGPPAPPPFLGTTFYNPSGLYDDTAGADVLTLASGVVVPTAYTVSVNLDHLYTLYAWSGTGPSRGITLGIEPASVPDSGSALTFFLVGLGRCS